MPVIASKLATTSDAFQANRARMLELIATLRALEARTRDA